METMKKTSKSNNHFVTSIPKSKVKTYEDMKRLKLELGCKLSDLIWYGIELTLKAENKPKSFGFKS
jgi:hypothetical protein